MSRPDQDLASLVPADRELIRKAIHRWCGRDENWHDREDFEQSALLTLLRLLPRARDEERERIVVAITRRIITHHVRARRADKRAPRSQRSLSELAPSESECFVIADAVGQEHLDAARRRHRVRRPPELLDLVLDLANVLATLPTELREVAERLMRGDAIGEIACRLGIHRATVGRRMQRLAEALREKNFGEF